MRLLLQLLEQSIAYRLLQQCTKEQQMLLYVLFLVFFIVSMLIVMYGGFNGQH